MTSGGFLDDGIGRLFVTVVDTSAMIALLLKEAKWEDVESVLRRQPCVIPTPVLLEFHTVAVGRYNRSKRTIDVFLDAIAAAANISIASFGAEDSLFARSASHIYGRGRQNRAQLNIVDLMVYGIAKRLDAPILCTGRDFAETDALIHPASRLS